MDEVEKPTARKEDDTGVNADELGDATWGDVFATCCVKTPQEWGMSFVSFLVFLVTLYSFLVGLDWLGNGAKVMSGCAAGELFGDELNPIAGLMIGVLVTVLMDSSSATTSLVIVLVGAGMFSIKQGIYFVMGANCGTTLTGTLVSLGHYGNDEEFERAFAAATIHDTFNYLSVVIFLPIEVATGMLYYLSKAMVQGYTSKDTEEFNGPVARWVDPLGMLVLMNNKKVTEGVAKGGKCEDFYPIVCEDMDNPSKDTCEVGLIKCDEDYGCPAFFDPYASQHDDVLSGVVVFIIGITLMYISLFALVKVLQHIMLGSSTRIIQKATNVNGYIGIMIGAALTMLIQSSSVFTATMTPLAGVGVISLEQVYPLMLGANIGTTLTGVLAALLNDANAMQVALSHVFFNIFGIFIFYPIPFMRNIVFAIARFNGRATRIWRGYPFVYILILFFVIPLVLLGVSTMFMQDSKALTTLAAIITVLIAIVLAWVYYYCKYNGGYDKCYAGIQKRQARSDAWNSLDEDMVWLKAKVKELSEHTGLPDEEAQETPATDDDKDAIKNDEEDA